MMREEATEKWWEKDKKLAIRKLIKPDQPQSSSRSDNFWMSNETLYFQR